jgi:hypothetical protein
MYPKVTPVVTAPKAPAAAPPSDGRRTQSR